MNNLLDPVILFFIFGVIAGALRSNLEIPEQVAKFLSLYLLMAIGLKGGFALAEADLNASVLASLGAAVAMAFVVPLLGYLFLRRHAAPFDAAALAAAYGSVSAVTFVTAVQVLDDGGLAVGGHMAVALVLMETPAIIMAVALAALARQTQRGATTMRVQAQGTAVLGGSGGSGGAAMAGFGVAAVGGWRGIGKMLHESLTHGANLLLLGALVIGYLSGAPGKAALQPFAGDLFKGLLALFLLDMGLTVARKLPAALKASPVLLAYALVAPLLHAGLALGLAWLLALPVADAALLMVLSASASYIVVPAVLKHAIPEANPALYLGLGLGVTFPFNLLVGIPLYANLAQRVLGPVTGA